MSTTKKPEGSYMIVQFNVHYDDHLVIPYKEGIALLAAMENARIYNKAYNQESKITDLKENTFKASSIGVQEYGEAILRATLLAENDSK
jgi:hypothetical protein